MRPLDNTVAMSRGPRGYALSGTGARRRPTSRCAPTIAPPGQRAASGLRRGFSIPNADTSPPSIVRSAAASIPARKASTEASSRACDTVARSLPGSDRAASVVSGRERARWIAALP